MFFILEISNCLRAKILVSKIRCGSFATPPVCNRIRASNRRSRRAQLETKFAFPTSEELIARSSYARATAQLGLRGVVGTRLEVAIRFCRFNLLVNPRGAQGFRRKCSLLSIFSRRSIRHVVSRPASSASRTDDIVFLPLLPSSQAHQALFVVHFIPRSSEPAQSLV